MSGVDGVEPRSDGASLILALQRAARAIDDAGDDEVLEITCEQVLSLLGCSSAVVLVADGSEAVLVALRGATTAHVGDRLPLESSLAGYVLRNGEPVLCTDVLVDPRANLERSLRSGTRSSVTAPMSVDGDVLGILKGLSPEADGFDETDLTTISLLARLATGRLQQVLREKEQVAADEALAERDRLIDTVFYSVEEGFWLLDGDGRVLTANPAADRILGLEPRLMIGRLADELFGRLVDTDGNFLSAEHNLAVQALRTGTTTGPRIVGIHAPLGLVWLEATAVPVRKNSVGPPAQVLLSFRDVSALRQRTDELSRSEARLRAIGQLAGLAWWELDLSTGERTWSAEMYELTFRDPSLGPPSLDEWLAMLHVDDREAGRQAAVHSLDVDGPRDDRAGTLLRVRSSGGDERVLQIWHGVRRVGAIPRAIYGTVLDATPQVKLARALTQSVDRLADAEGLLPFGFWQWDLASGALQWSEGMYRLVGVALNESMTAQRWSELKHPADLHSCDDLERRAITNGIGFHHVFRVLTPEGELRYLQAWTDAMRDEAGTIVGLHGATVDVTDRELVARSLESSERQFRVAFDEAPIGMSLLDMRPDSRGRLLRVNTALGRMLGYSIEQMLTMTVAEWTYPDDLEADRVHLAGLVSGELPAAPYAKRFLHQEGYEIHSWISPAQILGEDGQPLYLVSHILDVTEQREQQAELSRLALTDGLTGLANRTLLDDRIGHALDQLRRAPDALVGMLMLDLDRFKLVNDSLGHQVGDALLIEVARRLVSVCRRGTTVARQGGDEFVVLVEQAGTLEEVTSLAARIVESMRQPYLLPTGDTITSTVTIGIATTREPDLTVDDLVREADLALYHAKDAGRDGWAVFDDTLRARAIARVGVEAELRSALADDRLQMYLQPLVDLRRRIYAGSEALVRLARVDGILVLPGDFIDVAEDSGLIAAVDTRMLELALGHLKLDEHAGRISVNVSGRTLEHVSFVDTLERCLDESGVSPSRLAVELTESVLMFGNPVVKESIRRIGELGVALGIDDFGTGYSALAYLQAFELDFLKIDRSFVARLGVEPRAAVVITAIVDLAHAHGMTVTAEGVETAEQARLLTELDCDVGQGWFFGRPAPVA